MRVNVWFNLLQSTLLFAEADRRRFQMYFSVFHKPHFVTDDTSNVSHSLPSVARISCCSGYKLMRNSPQPLPHRPQHLRIYSGGYLLETFSREILYIIVDEMQRFQLKSLKRLIVDTLQEILRHFDVFYGTLQYFCNEINGANEN